MKIDIIFVFMLLQLKLIAISCFTEKHAPQPYATFIAFCSFIYYVTFFWSFMHLLIFL